MSKKINSEQIAKLAGVSRSTVSKVLHNYADVSDATREHVLKVMAETGYRPNIMSQALKGINPKVIAVYFFTRLHSPDDLYDMNSHYDMSVLTSLIIEAKSRGYSIMVEAILSIDGDEKIISLVNDAFESHRVCAAVFVGLDDKCTFISTVATPDRHIIVLDKRVDTLRGVRSIFANDRLSARRATEHLMENGYTRVFHISGDLHKLSGRERYYGYLDAVKQFNKDNPDAYYEPLLMEGVFSMRHGYNAAKIFIEKKLYEQYNGVVCGCDQIAIGFAKCLYEHRYDLVDKIGLIGFDNEPMDLYSSPTVSTMSMNFSNLARMIFDLEQNYDKFKGGINIKLDHDLIVRDSSRPFSERMTVSKAFREHIEQLVREGLLKRPVQSIESSYVQKSPQNQVIEEEGPDFSDLAKDNHISLF